MRREGNLRALFATWGPAGEMIMAYEFSKSGVRVTVGTGHRAAPLIGAANGTGLLQQTLELIHDKSPLRMSYWRGSSDKLVVVFNGVGTKPHEYPRNEFFKSATNNGKHHALQSRR